MSRRALTVVDPLRLNTEPSALEPALLPWEQREAFESLHRSYRDEHRPEGPTETSLVDQLVWLDWRRRRLVIGERAAHLAAAQERVAQDHKAGETVRRAMLPTAVKADKEELGQALATTPEKDGETLAETDADEAMTVRAIAILQAGDPPDYARGLEALRQDTADWWEDVVADDETTHPDGQPQAGEDYQPYARTGEQLLRFLRSEVMPFYAGTRGSVARRPAIRLQAQGESLDPFRMDRILALDERLTRQFEKALGMLLKLKEMRLAAKAE